MPSLFHDLSATMSQQRLYYSVYSIAACLFCLFVDNSVVGNVENFSEEIISIVK